MLVNSASHPRRRAVRVVMVVMMASTQHEITHYRTQSRLSTPRTAKYQMNLICFSNRI
jgi:hypothetical protein